MREIRIEEKNSGQRLDKYLLHYFPQMPKGFLYKMLRKKNICLNKRKASGNEILTAEDRIQVYFAEETLAEFQGNARQTAARTFGILYEDDDVLAVNKPAGLLSQPNGKDPDLIAELAGYLSEERFGVVSRLDRNTTGAVLVGKNIKSLQHLNQIPIQKIYRAILCGKLERELLLRDYLEKEENNKVRVYSGAVKADSHGKEIITKVIPLAQKGNFTLVQAEIRHGKPHQIRAHLASIGKPILGDFKYGRRECNERFRRQYGLNGQLLHSYQVIWDGHQVTAPYPELFELLQRELFEKEEKYGVLGEPRAAGRCF